MNTKSEIIHRMANSIRLALMQFERKSQKLRTREDNYLIDNMKNILSEYEKNHGKS